MGFKNLAKKWGKIALCASVATAGVIGSVTLGNSTQVSAALTDRYYITNVTSTRVSGGMVTNYDTQFIDAHNNSYNQTDFNVLWIGVDVRMNTSMSYVENSNYYVDIDNIDNFDYSRDVVKGNYVSSAENVNNFSCSGIYLISKTGQLSNYLKEGISNFDILRMVLEIAKNNVTLSDESATLNLASASQTITIRGLQYLENVEEYTGGDVIGIGHEHVDFGIDTYKITGYISSNLNPNSESLLKVEIYNKSLDEMVNGGGYTEEDLANARQEGVDSVDPTIDNQQAIDDYIINNNMKTEEEYNAYGESQFTAGVNSIDQTAIEQEGYDKGFTAGVSSVDPSADNEEAIKNHIEKEELKTKEEYEAHGKEQYDAGYKANSIWKKLGNFFTVSIPSFFKSGWNRFVGLFRKG